MTAELDNLRSFARDVHKGIRTEMLHKLGPNGRICRTILLFKRLVKQYDNILCLVYGCDTFAVTDYLPGMCKDHTAETILVSLDTSDFFLAELLVVGWPDYALPT